MPTESETAVHPFAKVLIVGGGPSGLVTLRNLVHRGNFPHVRLYERRDDIGGVWYVSVLQLHFSFVNRL